MNHSQNLIARILVADCDTGAVKIIADELQSLGHTVDIVHESQELENTLQSPYDVLILSAQWPQIDNTAFLEKTTREHPEVAVAVLIDNQSMETVLEYMRKGAFDYLHKPVDKQRLAVVARNGAERTRLRSESDGLRAAVTRGDRGPHLVCGSQAMTDVISLVERVASSKVPVLIYGEAGTGKELVAQRVHARSRRRDGPFVVVNCAVRPTAQLETLLFGNDSGTKGRIEEARGGTLLIDEVSELPLDLQSRLMRTLHEMQLAEHRQPTGMDVRVIATTMRHLPTEVSRGTFRSDLFYRLNVFSITVPPLRDRRDDIPALARYALSRIAAKQQSSPPQIAADVVEHLQRYAWPGNVRELFNVVDRMRISAQDGAITLKDLPEEIRTTQRTRPANISLMEQALSDDKQGIRPLHEIEREMMIAALRETHGNVSEAARRLGIGRATFYRRAQRHGLTREDGFPG